MPTIHALANVATSIGRCAIEILIPQRCVRKNDPPIRPSAAKRKTPAAVVAALRVAHGEVDGVGPGPKVDRNRTRPEMAIRAQVDLQKLSGGNANIGRELFPVLGRAGFDSIQVSPRMVYVDSSKPELVEGFTKNTFTAMIEGVRDTAIASGKIAPSVFDDGIKALYRTCETDGVFCYTFFKALAVKD